MRDIEDRDLVNSGVDLIKDAVSAPTSTPDADERADQLSSDTPWFFKQRTGDEFDHRRGNSLRKLLCDSSSRRTGDDELERNLVSAGHEAI
jgi:hypothetical protein